MGDQESFDMQVGPSLWRPGPTEDAIVDFLTTATVGAQALPTPERVAASFLDRARHPRFERAWPDLGFAPMILLMHVLHPAHLWDRAGALAAFE